MTHAPGPWKIGIGTDAGQILDHDGERVARLTNDPTAAANARLIAAAPDLLAAVRRIMDHADGEDQAELFRAIGAASEVAGRAEVDR